MIESAVPKWTLWTLLCTVWFLSGCATLPSMNRSAVSVSDQSDIETAQAIGATDAVAASAVAVNGDAPVANISDANTSVASATDFSQPPCPAPTQQSAPIQQVGFRDRMHVGDDCGCQFGPCADNACGGDGCGEVGPCVTPGYAMPVVPQRWYYDPQEFLCDGGDRAPDAKLRTDDRIMGLQTEDTVSHYTTESGKIEFTASNRVCVYSPRFGSVRRITGAILNDRTIAASGVVRPVGPQGVDYDQPGLVMRDSLELDQAAFTHRIDSMRDRNRGVRIENIQQLEMAGDTLALLTGIQNIGLTEIDEAQLAIIERLAIAASTWTIDESVEVEILDLKPPVLTRDQNVDSLVVYDFPDAGRLNLIKLADKQHAGIGDEVTFALRLQNVGDSAVSNVVVTDNLTTRLAYVADSQSASIQAEFESRPNDAGSTQLSWTLKEELAVGDSVLIEFKCRVR
ncbi:conserved repeat domain-containing protein [Neorhodopirellula lusitana]|uniref:Conserved repeat domain-containing protein n=1 Tax=Neorhodopirellula lusitana TaxID=445327 RepID=A0ABY1PY40_9BACT|nr:DUF11 domain-containing protein [Neorhodopirellula lusitana]SMP50934.1 conserved repeat domain-containing protein [Neorhodopirellula lusitana]